MIDLTDADDVLFKVADGQTIAIDATATIEDAASGEVSYTFSSDEDLPPGTYNAEFWIIWDSTSDVEQKVPPKGYIEIDVQKPLDGTYDPADWDDPDITVTNVYADAVHTEEVNKIKWATSPDEITTKFNELPSYGGIVRLVPGDYTDADWSNKIVIPTEENAVYGLDMSGSRIVLDSFSPTGEYILRDTDSNVTEPQPVNIIGPSVFDVSAVTDPPNCATLWDIAMSRVWFPRLEGGFDWCVESKTNEGSGHWNTLGVMAKQVNNGIRIHGNTISNDRNIIYGQIMRLADGGVACQIDDGSHNQIYVQPENEQDGASATGIEILGPDSSWGNTVWNTHTAGLRITRPLHIEGRHTKLKFPAQAVNKVFNGSEAAINPRNIESPLFTKTCAEFSADYRPLFDTTGDGSTSLTNFNRVALDAGTTDGNVQPLQTPSRVGLLSSSIVLYSRNRISGETGSGARYSVGLWVDNSNYVMFVADGSNSNWLAEVVVGGTTEASVDTGQPIDTGIHRFHLNLGETEQAFMFDRQTVATTSVDISSFSAPERHRVAAEVNGSPASAPGLETLEMEHLGN
ncbi:hypothetical protein JMJ58_14930 [Haloterrigena salifodinae]|uniref:Uncharacterized protein n=1 Tax=Haloterrigena salifodinae TaxID=2675099 RepID=A0A8T8DXB3_9EURY|nr:hypothetical protein [Haloterrigena salifodinae]QRV14228.1 hypothetical protein JMJ58_14930 [Haloterrigena salifodinae]